MPVKTRNRNAQDITLIQLHSLKKKVEALTIRVQAVEATLRSLTRTKKR